MTKLTPLQHYVLAHIEHTRYVHLTAHANGPYQIKLYGRRVDSTIERLRNLKLIGRVVNGNGKWRLRQFQLTERGRDALGMTADVQAFFVASTANMVPTYESN